MKIAFSETSDLQLLHPVTDEPLVTEKGKPMIAKIYGKHTAAYKNAVNKLLKAEQKRGKKELSLDEAEGRNNVLLAECVDSFVNLELETEDGVVDPKDILGVIGHVFWIKDQINTAITELEGFIVAPQKV